MRIIKKRNDELVEHGDKNNTKMTQRGVGSRDRKKNMKDGSLSAEKKNPKKVKGNSLFSIATAIN